MVGVKYNKVPLYCSLVDKDMNHLRVILLQYTLIEHMEFILK